jgi:preprotein translocase subunit SecG
MPLWDLVRTHRRSTAWLVFAWMMLVLLLLIIGPVWRP